VNLGSTDDPGGNMLDVNGFGVLIQNTGAMSFPPRAIIGTRRAFRWQIPDVC